VGRRLLHAVTADRTASLSLHVFARNVRARRFYEAAGFVLVGAGDGTLNEEGEPDCTYRWSGRHQPTDSPVLREGPAPGASCPPT
jgi:RimJ/RimL family protein N-acetyltransferase